MKKLRIFLGEFLEVIIIMKSFFAMLLGCIVANLIIGYLTRNGKHPYKSSSGKFPSFKCTICGEICSSYYFNTDNNKCSDEDIFVLRPNKYCSNCGQKLNWNRIDTSEYTLIRDKEEGIFVNISESKEK